MCHCHIYTAAHIRALKCSARKGCWYLAGICHYVEIFWIERTTYFYLANHSLHLAHNNMYVCRHSTAQPCLRIDLSCLVVVVVVVSRQTRRTKILSCNPTNQTEEPGRDSQRQEWGTTKLKTFFFYFVYSLILHSLLISSPTLPTEFPLFSSSSPPYENYHIPNFSIFPLLIRRSRNPPFQSIQDVYLGPATLWPTDTLCYGLTIHPSLSLNITHNTTSHPRTFNYTLYDTSPIINGCTPSIQADQYWPY
jgi:hypothetical protein